MEFYQTVSLDSIMRGFIDMSRNLVKEYEYFLDPVKNVVVFRIVTKDLEENDAE